MTTNIWQRLADAIVSPHDDDLYTEASPLVRALRKLAAEDAEREGPFSATPWPGRVSSDARSRVVNMSPDPQSQRDVGAVATEIQGEEAGAGSSAPAAGTCPRCGADGAHTFCVDRDGKMPRPGPVPDTQGGDAASVASFSRPAQGLPPLDPALVVECLRIYFREFYAHVDDVPYYEGAMRAALTHHRERVERPLREALTSVRRFNADAELEVKQLRAEVKYWQSGHEGQLQAALAANKEADRLRGELAHWQEECARQHLRNEEYYRGLVVQIGESIGDASYIADDGTRSEDVLCAKVPELVAALVAQRVTQPTDEDRRRWANQIRQGNWFGTADRERIATLLEQPAPRAKSLGRRWVVIDGEKVTDSCADHAALVRFYPDATITECDLVPVEEEP